MCIEEVRPCFKIPNTVLQKQMNTMENTSHMVSLWDKVQTQDCQHMKQEYYQFSHNIHYNTVHAIQ